MSDAVERAVSEKVTSFTLVWIKIVGAISLGGGSSVTSFTLVWIKMPYQPLL